VDNPPQGVYTCTSTGDSQFMNIVFAALPAYGHLYPMLPLATACADAGHTVTIATAEPFLDALPLPTARGMSDEGLGVMESETLRENPGVSGLAFATAMFSRTVARRTSKILPDTFGRLDPDLVVFEALNVGAAVAADQLGIRSMAFGIGLWNPVLRTWLNTAAAFHQHTWAPGPAAYLDPVPRSLQFSLPEHRLPIRTTPWSPPVPTPQWLLENRRRPRVYITLGTVSFGAVEVLRRAVLETAAHDVDVLVAVGPNGDLSLLGEVPANVRLERFVPQAEVLRRVDLLVHHGGAGTMLGALANGLPQLVLPQGADHPVNAAAVTMAGAGDALTNDEQTPGRIGEAVGRLLADGPQRRVAREIAEEIAATPSPAAALGYFAGGTELGGQPHLPGQPDRPPVLRGGTAAAGGRDA
jgi:Protein of unknown function (DUF1205)